jgi:hypothetical protein
MFARAMSVALITLLLVDPTNMALGFQIVPLARKCTDGGPSGLLLRSKRYAPSLLSCTAASMNFNEQQDPSTETTSGPKQNAVGEVLPSTMFFSSESSAEEAARKRAKSAREALRRSQLVGEAIPSDWTRGNHFRDGDRDLTFGPGELVVFKGHFAVVQMYDEQGMVVVEAACGERPGSRSMRHLGPTVLGKISEGSLQALMQQ